MPRRYPQNGIGAYYRQRPVRLSINTSTSLRSPNVNRQKGEKCTGAVQILDIIREDTGALDAKKTETTTDRQYIPERAEGTVVRWIHLTQEPQDPYALLELVLKEKNIDKTSTVGVCKLLHQFQKDQERDSNHGRYFEPAFFQINHDSDVSKQTRRITPTECPGASTQLQFISLPYLTYGHSPPAVGELHRSLHPPRTLFQHQYRRESASTLSQRDSEQTCRKVRGQTSESLMLVHYLWILAINDSTIITSTPNSGTPLWRKLKLVSLPAFSPLGPTAPQGKSRPEEETRSIFYSEAPPRSSLTELSSEVNDKVIRLVQLQWRINSLLPNFLSTLLDKYEGLLILGANIVQSEFIQSSFFLRAFFKPRILVTFIGALTKIFTDKKWKDELAAELEDFTVFCMDNTARWQQLELVTPFASSEELQTELVRLYSKILKYANYFLQPGGPPLVKNKSFKSRTQKIFEDIRELAIVLEWNAETVRMKADVFADAGLPEIENAVDKPSSVSELIKFIIDSYIPEDSMKTSRAYVSELYAQHLSTLQFESQQAPTKALVKDINQIAEELDIVSGLVKSQQKVLLHFRRENPDDTEKLDMTVQKLDFFLADIEEYKRSCTRLASLTAQQVELQIEHHGKAILVFTVVTLLFLPLSFVSSFFGMNVIDIRNTQQTQWVFWVAAMVTTVVVVGASVVVAFFGEDMLKSMGIGPWGKAKRREKERLMAR